MNIKAWQLSLTELMAIAVAAMALAFAFGHQMRQNQQLRQPSAEHDSQSFR